METSKESPQNPLLNIQDPAAQAVDLADRLSRYHGLIFDCDGTLTDSMPLHFYAWQETMRRHGIEFYEERFYSLGGMPTDKIIRLLSDEHGVDVDVETASLQKEAAFRRRVDDVTPKTDVCSVVRQMRGRSKLAVASGGEREMVVRQLEVIRLRDHFEAIVAAEDTQRHKPEPDVFLEAANRLRVAPESCLVWEDSGLGFQAARDAGMDCIDVRTSDWVFLSAR